MAKQAIMSDKLAKPRVPLSRAIRSGDYLFVSGISPMDAAGNIAVGDFEAQIRQVMTNSDFPKVNEIYRSYFAGTDFPARTTIIAGLAHPDFLLEIECTAEA